MKKVDQKKTRNSDSGHESQEGKMPKNQVNLQSSPSERSTRTELPPTSSDNQSQMLKHLEDEPNPLIQDLQPLISPPYSSYNETKGTKPKDQPNTPSKSYAENPNLPTSPTYAKDALTPRLHKPKTTHYTSYYVMSRYPTLYDTQNHDHKHCPLLH